MPFGEAAHLRLGSGRGAGTACGQVAWGGTQGAQGPATTRWGPALGRCGWLLWSRSRTRWRSGGVRGQARAGVLGWDYGEASKAEHLLSMLCGCRLPRPWRWPWRVFWRRGPPAVGRTHTSPTHVLYVCVVAMRQVSAWRVHSGMVVGARAPCRTEMLRRACGRWVRWGS